MTEIEEKQYRRCLLVMLAKVLTGIVGIVCLIVILSGQQLTC